VQKIVTTLWFNGRVQEALDFYTSLLPDSRVLNIINYSEVGPGSSDEIMFATFELAGQRFTLVNGNSFFEPNAAMSLCINCEDQAEIDRLWEIMTANGGVASQAGWLTDRFGVSWQVTSPRLHELLASEDAAAVVRVTKAFMQMSKLDIAKLEQAFRGD